jgi:hypothetical protein
MYGICIRRIENIYFSNEILIQFDSRGHAIVGTEQDLILAQNKYIRLRAVLAIALTSQPSQKKFVQLRLFISDIITRISAGLFFDFLIFPIFGCRQCYSR